MLKMVDGTGIIGVDMVCPLGVSTPQPPNYDRVELEGAGMLVLPNSLDAPLEGLELGGKTEQVQTTGAQLFDKNSVVNGVIIADGSVTDNAPLYVTSDYIPVKPSVMYACTETGSKRLKFFDIDKQPVQKINFEDANVERGSTFTTGETTRFIRLSLLREKLDSIMLNEGSKSISYEPYTGGKPSPSQEYQQEIKNVGKWNEGTQKYEVDVKITNAEQNWSKEQVLTLTSDRPITKWDKLVEQGGQIGWLYQSASDTDVKPSRLDLFPYGFSFFKDFGNGVYVYKVVNIKKAIGFQTSLCEQFKNKDGSYSTGDLFCYSDQPSIQMQYFVTDIPTLEEFKTWMETNPLTMVYQTVESQFVPLPQSEQNAIRALTTYYPTTVITADGGELDPDIKVTYRKEI